jgi:hypothetical protein
MDQAALKGVLKTESSLGDVFASLGHRQRSVCFDNLPQVGPGGELYHLQMGAIPQRICVRQWESLSGREPSGRTLQRDMLIGISCRFVLSLVLVMITQAWSSTSLAK